MRATAELSTAMQEIETARAKMAEMGTTALEREIKKGFRLVREHVVRVAAALVELESRGRVYESDNAEERLFVATCRQIGKGKIHVDAFMRFGGRGHTFDALKALPIEKQTELLEMPDAKIEECLKKPVRVTPRGSSPAARSQAATANGQPLSIDALVEQAMRIVTSYPDPAAAASALMRRLVDVLAQKAA